MKFFDRERFKSRFLPIGVNRMFYSFHEKRKVLCIDTPGLTEVYEVGFVYNVV